MTLEELKAKILDKTIDRSFLIFVCPDSTFIADQYIKRISDDSFLDIHSISSLDDISNKAVSLVYDYANDLNVLRTQTFEELKPDYSEFENTIVVCKSVDKKIASTVEPYTVNFGKVLDWQVKDYIKVKCKGLDKTDIDWLYENVENLYKLDNEIAKISLFEDQKEVLSALKNPEYSDIYKYNFSSFMNAVLNGDRATVASVLEHRKYLSLEPYGMVAYLLTCCKSSLNRSRDINQKKRLKQKIEFLASYDYRLKNGDFDNASDSFMVDFILAKMLV